MRTLIVSTDWPTTTGGGVATLARAAQHALTARLGAGDVITAVRGGGLRSFQLRNEGGVVALPGRSWRHGGAQAWAKALRPVIERHDPERILSMSWESTEGATIAAPGVAVWTFAHGRDVLATLEPPDRSARRDTIVRSGRPIFVLTRWLRDLLVSRGGGPCHLVHAAVPGPADAPPRPPGGRTVLALGRLVVRKGHASLIDAFAEEPLRDRGARLDIVGEGPQRAELASRIDRLRLGDRVALHGALGPADLAERWARSSVFALCPWEPSPGDVEGYGLVFDEAGAWRRPTVTTASGGSSEAVQHGLTGLVVGERSTRAIANTIATLLDDPALGDRLGAAGRRRWEERSPLAFADSLIAAWTSTP